jgi:hypothetical protein
MKKPVQNIQYSVQEEAWIMVHRGGDIAAGQRAAREGHCFQHVQATTVAIDQYAEKALGNRDYFLNKPYGVG